MQPSLHRPIPGQRSVASVEPAFGRRRRDRARGQTLVEFALVIPLFIVMLVGIIEFGFAMNAVLAVSFATREAALVAAEAGSADGADCMILTKVEESISAPSDDRNITRVLIFKSDHNGTRLATNTYARTGSTTCTYSGGSTLTVPYTLSGAENYEDMKRCSHARRLRRESSAAGHDDRRPRRRPGRLRLLVADAAVESHRTGRQRLHDHRVQLDADGADPVSGLLGHGRSGSRERGRDDSGERGQSLVELAIALPVVMLLLLGMLEFGFAFSHHLTLEYATREGARTGAALANGSPTVSCSGPANVDAYVIAAVQRVITSPGSRVPVDQIQEIRIYKANSTGQDTGTSNRWVPGAGPTVEGAVLQFTRSGSTVWNPCLRQNSGTR